MTQPAVELESENFLDSAHGYSPCRHACSPKNSRAWRQWLAMRNPLPRLPTLPFRHREHLFRKTRKSVHVQPKQPFTINRNRCSRSTEMTVHLRPKYATAAVLEPYGEHPMRTSVLDIDADNDWLIGSQMLQNEASHRTWPLIVWMVGNDHRPVGAKQVVDGVVIRSFANERAPPRQFRPDTSHACSRVSDAIVRARCDKVRRTERATPLPKPAP